MRQRPVIRRGHMFFGNYTFSLKCTGQISFSKFMGSDIRGRFGKILRETTCNNKGTNCSECLLNQFCLYTETMRPDLYSGQAGYSGFVPPPVVIRPPDPPKPKYEEGEILELDLILFGNINKRLPAFIFTFRRMGQTGIGEWHQGKRNGFTLQEVRYRGECLYSEGWKTITEPVEYDTLDLVDDRQGNDCPMDLKVHFLTPLRVKSMNRLSDSLSFKLLVRCLLRRYSSLMSAYGKGDPPLDYQGLISDAENIETVNSSLKWSELSRYSYKQKKRMSMGGIAGSIVYRGDIAKYLPLIQFCSRTHLGKQTFFGLGRMDYSIRKI